MKCGSGLDWEPHHGWTEGVTERVDGFLVSDGKVVAQLDIASYGDDCCVDSPNARAEKAWAEGRVLLDQDYEVHGVDTLIVPADALTTDLISEALRRFQP